MKPSGFPFSTPTRNFSDTLQPFCDMAAKERNATTGTLRSAVEREVETLLPHGKADGADCRQEFGAQCPHAVAAARRMKATTYADSRRSPTDEASLYNT